jgi:hypothetical protein
LTDALRLPDTATGVQFAEEYPCDSMPISVCWSALPAVESGVAEVGVAVAVAVNPRPVSTTRVANGIDRTALLTRFRRRPVYIPGW